MAPSLVFQVLAQLDQNPVAAFGVQKGYQFVVRPPFGPFAQYLKALLAQPFDLRPNVVDGKGDMVHPFAPFLQKAGNGAVVGKRLQQFDLAFAGLKEGGDYPLRGYLLYLIVRPAQKLFKQQVRGLQVLNGYADMFYFLQLTRVFALLGFYLPNLHLILRIFALWKHNDRKKSQA